MLINRLYWPAACDLARKKGLLSRTRGTIVPGPETAASCERALLVAEQSRDGNYVIVSSAGVPPDPDWDGVQMSAVMTAFLIDGGGDPDKIDALVADRFDTIGEVKEIVAYLEQNSSIQEVIICCKWWHILRCWITLDAYLTLSDKINRPVKIKVEPCESWVLDTAILREFWLATPLTMLKILLDRPRVFFKLWTELVRGVREVRHGRQIMNEVQMGE